MLFNSVLFVEFFLLVTAGFFVLRALAPARLQKLWLLVASYVFYATWNPPFVLLLAFSTLIDFLAGIRLARARGNGARRVWLAISLAVNFGALGFFKYANFFFENLTSIGGAEWQPLDIVLPLGISFYTFQTLSYTIDVYRGQQPPCRSLLDFALYVSFFPQLVAGPIVRSQDFLPQLRSRCGASSKWESGFRDIAIGFVKKVVFADTLGVFVDRVFADPGAHSASTLALGAYAYAYQIYFDFSGYSDIAIGLAALLGFDLRKNFDHPYLATNPAEFWRRWHISLSTWLRDYLYIPLGGNRKGTLLTHRNLMITMLLGGLWHGAAWNFVFWGAYHGFLLAAHRFLTRERSPLLPDVPTWMGRIFMFHLALVGWILFRVESLADFATYLSGLAEGVLAPSDWSNAAAVVVAAGALLHLIEGNWNLRAHFTRMAPELQACAYAAATFAVVLLGETSARFIYFQF